MFSKDLYPRHVKTRACLGKGLQLRSYHCGWWCTCVSWLSHTSTNTTFLFKATNYFSHMLLQTWEANIRRKESSPQPGIELTITWSWVWHPHHWASWAGQGTLGIPQQENRTSSPENAFLSCPWWIAPLDPNLTSSLEVDCSRCNPLSLTFCSMLGSTGKWPYGSKHSSSLSSAELYLNTLKKNKINK